MTARPPVEKLPLAVRKNVRDEFEAKRPDLESQISKLLGGETWKINVNPNLLFAYAEEGGYPYQSLGACITAYVNGAIYRLKYFLESQGHGEEGVAEINTLASEHTITMVPDLEKKVSYCGVDIKDGVLRILFKEDCLGTNIDYALEKIEQALNQASASGPEAISYTARNSIKQDWTSKVEQLQKDIAEQLHNTDIKLNPNFEANAAALANGGKDVRDDWETNLGSFTKKYFESLLYYLKYNKFGEDDLLYEGFGELVTANEVKFNVVDRLKGGSSYNEIIIENGALLMQTKPATFGTNIDGTCEKIVDIL